MNFTQDEMNMLCIYNGSSREKTISELREMRTYLEPDETELRELTDSTLTKLEKISQSKGVDFIISMSLDKDELPENIKKNVLVSL